MNQSPNMVTASVFVGNSRVNYVSLRIEQTYGDHHYFWIELDHETVSKTFMDKPEEQIRQIGRMVSIEFRHGENSPSVYLFSGIITKVRMTGKDGKKGYIILEGASPTIMLERGRRMDVYSNVPLRNIFKKVVDGVYTDYLTCLNEPTYKTPIDFVMQYNETDWEFLKRLAWLYNENMFYSGRELLFGEYEEWEPVKLTYDYDISDIDFCSKMVENDSISYQYLPEQDNTLEQQSPTTIENSNKYLETASQQNNVLTSEKPARNIIAANIGSRSEMNELSKRKKSRNAAQTIYVTGKTKTYQATIGRLITILMPENFSNVGSLGTYRVVKSIHTIDERLHYSNQFEAVPAYLSTMPIQEPKMPQAESVVAQVISNEDPLNQGRVQVSFEFANQSSRIWMRVMSPNAGIADDKTKNRGFMFVPEQGDQVMIGFEYGDPNRPYVMGSMYHAKNGQGGQEKNHLKTIITRSGHTLEFDDAPESLGITIKDKKGNQFHLDSKGNNIEITALETITLKAKDIRLEAENNIEAQAQADIKVDAMGIAHIGSQGNLDVTTQSDMQLKAMASTSVEATSEMRVKGASTKVESSSDTEVIGTNTSVKGQNTTVSGAGHKIEIM